MCIYHNFKKCLKIHQMNFITKQKQTHLDLESTLMVARGQE